MDTWTMASVESPKPIPSFQTMYNEKEVVILSHPHDGTVVCYFEEGTMKRRSGFSSPKKALKFVERLLCEEK